MAQVHVLQRDGMALEVTLDPQLSLMEVIRNAGVEDEFALCGGSLSCATCHVYVDPAVVDDLPPISDEESDLLDASERRKPGSRLSCQGPCNEVLADRRVEVAPAD